MEVPENLLYTQEHEWVRVEGNKAVVGIPNLHKSNWETLCL